MINVTQPYLPDIDKYKSYIDEIYANGWVTNNGPLVQKLERKLADYLGVKHLLLVANGTLALQVAIRLLQWRGQKVITSPYSFVATTSALVWEGVEPIFVDIDPLTCNLNPVQVEKVLQTRTDIAGALPVHVYGMHCAMEHFDRLSQQYKVPILYDAAHAFGVTYQDESLLNFGDISILSFHATKLYHTIEGGALVFKDESLYQQAKQLINFGIDDKAGGDIKTLGINAKLSEVHAAMGLCVLEDMPHILLERQKLWQRYHEKSPEAIQIIKIDNATQWNYSYFPILLPTEGNMKQIMNKLASENISSRRYFYPSLETLPYTNPDGNLTCPIAKNIAKRVLCLPLYYGLSQHIQDKIIGIVQSEAKL